MCHHTASGPSSDGWDDVNYMCFYADAAPLTNLYLNRTGTVWVCAAGATNTNGSGVDPCGMLPDDTMNANAIGIEAANNGVGETWPEIQLDAYVALVGALCDAYDIAVEQVHGHAEYAVGRKVDPAGPPRYATSSNTWNMDEFRDDISWAPVPEPQPPPGDHDMATSVLILEDANPPGAMYRCGPESKTWIADGGASGQVWLRINESSNGTRMAVDGFIYHYMKNGNLDVVASYGPIIGPRPEGHDEYGRH